MPEHNNCLLSLALIMRDAAGEVLECLKSVAEAVDEMVVVDTGSVDDSVAVVRQFLQEWQKEKNGRMWELGAVKWRDDFALAKNQALLRCHGQYVIFLDSDESLSEETRGNLRPLVEALARGEWPKGIKPVELPGRTPVPGKDAFELLEIRRHNVDMTGASVPGEPDDVSTRLFRRRDNLFYVGEVHEQLKYEDGTPTKIAVAEEWLLRILHTGYRPEVKDKKEERNNRILLKEEAQGGSTQLKDYHLANLHLERKEWPQALAAAKRCLAGYRPVHGKDAPYRIMYKAVGEMEKEALQRAGLSTREGGVLPKERQDEPEALKEARGLRRYAEQIIIDAIKEFPDYPGAYYRLGLRRKNGGDQALGAAALRRAHELAETFPAKYPEEDFPFKELMPELEGLLAQLGKEPQADVDNRLEQFLSELMASEKWQFYVAKADSLGGRAVRHQLSLVGESYKVLEESTPEERQESSGRKGLFLPFLEIDRENQKTYLPKVALALQKARGFRRIVVMLREPLPEVLSLIARHQQKWLPCKAVCACPGELFGGEKEGEPFTTAEELLDMMSAQKRNSPRKRLLLPYGQKQTLHLSFVSVLAGAAVYAMRQDDGRAPLAVQGDEVTYQELAEAAAEAVGFEGRLQYGKGRLPKAQALPPGLRLMQSHKAYGLKECMRHLARRRQRGGKIFLSACLIMRDSEADLARCLESLYPADEIIVVDTGSVDKSVEIAQRYTDKVYHFDWIDDFSAAKNFALDKSQGDWVVFLDSDEFLTPESSAGLRRLVEDFDGPGWRRQLLVRRQELDKELRPLGKDSEGAASRIFSRGVRFEGAIHEAMVMEDGQRPPAVMVPRERCLLKHTGYDSERVQEKLDRNARILRRAHEIGEDIPLQHFCMGKTYMSEKKYAQARQEMQLALQEEILPVNFRADIYRIWYNASKHLQDAGAMAEAASAMRRDMPKMPDSYVWEGVALWNAGEKEQAAPLLLKGMELSRDFLQYNLGEANVIAKDLPPIAKVLAEYHEARGEKEEAERVRNILTSP